MNKILTFSHQSELNTGNCHNSVPYSSCGALQHKLLSALYRKSCRMVCFLLYDLNPIFLINSFLSEEEF